MGRPIYHLCRRRDWQAACETGRYAGSAQDIVSGFIRFFTAEQLRDSAARYHAGQGGLVLLTVDADKVRDVLQWKEASTGEHHPRLCGPLPLHAVIRVDDVPLDVEGRHQFPELPPTSEDH